MRRRMGLEPRRICCTCIVVRGSQSTTMKYGMSGDKWHNGFFSAFFETIFVPNSLVAPRCTLEALSAATRHVGNLSMIPVSSVDLKTGPVKQACVMQLFLTILGLNCGRPWFQSGGLCLKLAAVTQSRVA